LSNDWQPNHVTIGLFEAIEIIGQTLAINLTYLLDKYGLRKKIITYVKDEGSNFNAMIITLKVVVNSEPLGLEESFQGTCFGHVNMALQRKRCVRIYIMFLLSLFFRFTKVHHLA
jgi:hypothetical protein